MSSCKKNISVKKLHKKLGRKVLVFIVQRTDCAFNLKCFSKNYGCCYHLTPSSFHSVLYFCFVSVSFESCSCILYSPTQSVVDALVDPNRTYRLVVIHGPLGTCTSLACHAVLVTVGWVGEGWIETHLNIEIITFIDYWLIYHNLTFRLI